MVQRKVMVDPSAVCIAGSSPRYLLVTIRQAELSVNCMVIHAPTSATPNEDIWSSGTMSLQGPPE